jgi:hypothetical protein
VIRHAYEWLFASMYRWSIRIDGDKRRYNLTFAILSLTFGLLFNLLSIAAIVDRAVPWPLLQWLTDAPYQAVVSGIVPMVALQYLNLRSGDRYRTILAKFPADQTQPFRRQHAAVIAYMVLSWLVFSALLFLVARSR